MSDFFVFGGKDQLGVVNGDQVLLVNNPLLRRCDVDLNQSMIEVTTRDDDGRRYMNGMRSEPELTLNILAGGGIITTTAMPRELRTVDDMTIRQLLAAVNRKIKARQ